MAFLLSLAAIAVFAAGIFVLREFSARPKSFYPYTPDQ